MGRTRNATNHDSRITR